MDSPSTIASGSTRRIVVLVVISVAMAAFLTLLGWGLANREPPTGRSGATRVGKPAPEFSLPRLDGGSLALADLRGAPAVVNFWASWCPPCRAELPLLEATSKEYPEVRFVGVNIQDTAVAATSTARTYALSYPNVYDETSRIAVDYGVVGLPVTFFLDAEGTVVRRAVGALSPAGLNGALAELLAGETPGTDIVNDGQFFEF